jgi:microcystin-dependent protein
VAQPYVGEIRLFAGNFAPSGWMICDGQPLPISEYEVLFELIGTTYGGDGQETFSLPDLRSRAPIHMGAGPSGTTYQIGEAAGVERVTLSLQQIPSHTHGYLVSTDAGTQISPANAVLGSGQSAKVYRPGAATTAMNGQSLAMAGGSQPHENMQPYLGLNHIISLFGIFPSQS